MLEISNKLKICKKKTIENACSILNKGIEGNNEMEKLIIQNMGNNLGDFFFIELEKDGIICVIMVDSHTIKNGFTKSAKSQIGKYDKIDYLILTHIDGDHIGGFMKFYNNRRFRDKFENTVIIYNFVTQRRVNYKDAFRLESMIDGHYVIPTGRYDYVNFSNELLRIISLEKRTKFDVNNTCAYLTLIAPNRDGIQSVQDDYYEKLEKVENDTNNIKQPKNNIINHNSIVFLLEFAKKKLLFMGDNDINQIASLIDGLKNMDNAKIDMIKIGHHGALEENKGLVEFAKKHKCNQLIVTGEEIWNKKHPHEDIMSGLNNSEITDIHLYTKINFGENNFSNIQICNKQEITILN